MTIEYHINQPITRSQFIQLLHNSTLGERRPVDDVECIDGVLANSNLVVSAWYQQTLVGIARSMTDFHYACYLSDLAVCQTQQKKGIGKQLLKLTAQQLKPSCKLILIAAPAANSYYQHLGFIANPRCWIMDKTRLL